jgi:hypothetical protein
MHRMPGAMRICSDEVFQRHKVPKPRPKIPKPERLCGMRLIGSGRAAPAAAGMLPSLLPETRQDAFYLHHPEGVEPNCSDCAVGIDEKLQEGETDPAYCPAPESLRVCMRSGSVIRQELSKATRHMIFFLNRVVSRFLKCCIPSGVELSTVLVLKTECRRWVARRWPTSVKRRMHNIEELSPGLLRWMGHIAASVHEVRTPRHRHASPATNDL